VSFDKVTSRIIRAWIISLMEKKVDPRSVNRKLATLRSFYKFLKKQNIIILDLSANIKSLKIKKSLPVFVPEGQLISLLDKFPYPDTFAGVREKLIIELLYATGIRLSELISLKEKDVNLFERTIKVLGKRNKQRIIPFSKSIGLIIEKYRSFKNKNFHNNSENYLLVTDKGSPCYPMFIYRIVKYYLELIPAVEKKSPHVLRHTFATHMLDKGADLNAIKELLGHSNLAATQVYTHNSLDKLKAIFDQAHPKA